MKISHSVLIAVFMIICILMIPVKSIGKILDSESVPLTWQREAGLRVETIPHNALAPDVQKQDDGSYRMYYTVTGQGVGSAISEDGLTWTIEEGLRMTSLRHDSTYQEGMVGFDLGHPWLVRLDDGKWRMYLQASAALNTPLRIVSAISDDGETFALEEGIRVDIGENSGPPALSFAGHGRAMKHQAGYWIMVFSGNLWSDRNLSDIMLATSSDGLNWQVVDSCVANNGHDPTLLQLTDNRWAMVYAYLKESLQVRFSGDGLAWSEPQVLHLLDETGQPMDEVHGDVTLMQRPDGGLRLMSNAVGGITSFIPVTTGISNQNQLPESFVLYQNFPNPFNPETHIGWDQHISGIVEISIFDVTGKLVKTLVNENKSVGSYSICWNGVNNNGIIAPSGNYFCRITMNGNTSQTKKMIFMK